MKLALKLSAIINFWLYYFGSIESAKLQIFTISTKTIKFLLRLSWKKKQLNSKFFNSQQINFHLLLNCWHSSAVIFLLSTTSFCWNFFTFYWLKKKQVCEVVMNSSPIKSSWLNEIIFHRFHERNSIKLFFINFTKQMKIYDCRLYFPVWVEKM